MHHKKLFCGVKVRTALMNAIEISFLDQNVQTILPVSQALKAGHVKFHSTKVKIFEQKYTSYWRKFAKMLVNIGLAISQNFACGAGS